MPTQADLAPPIPPPTLDAATTRRLLGRLRPHRRAVFVGLVLSLLGSGAAVLQPLAAREVLEAVAADRSLLPAVAVLLAVVVLTSVANMFGTFVMERTAEAVVRDTRRGTVARILAAPVLQIQRLGGGQLVSRVVADSTLLKASAGPALTGIAGGLLTIVVSLVLMATIDPVLLLTTIATVVVASGAFGLLLPRIARDTTAAQAAVGELASTVEPVVRQLRTVKMAGEQRREQAAADRATDDAYRHGVRAARATAIVTAGTEAALQLSFLVALGVGGARTASGAISVPDLIAYLLYVMLLIGPVVMIVAALTELQSAVAADTRLYPVEMLRPETLTEEALAGASGVATPGGFVGAAGASTSVAAEGRLLELRGVVVRAGERRLLDGLDLSLETGSFVGVVGPSGAGKTTLLELLCRFRDADEGRAGLLGRELTAWDRSDLRRRIGYVEQDAPLMPGTLDENLRYGAPDATPGDVQRVIDQLGLRPLLQSLGPDGLDAVVGPAGRSLSGGERQRVAIARALLRRPALLLLDESSSQLDAHAESAVSRAMRAASAGCSVMAVAHRLATIMDADTIVVLEAGRVRALGTHAELCETDDLYRSLAEGQGVVGHRSPCPRPGSAVAPAS